MEPLTLLFAFLIAFGTMFFGALSGGVGFVLRPLLIFLGFSPVVVIGSVRSSVVISEIPNMLLLHKRKKIDWKLVRFLIIPMFLGSFIAGILVLSILKGSIELTMGILLFIAGIVLVLNKNKGLKERKFHSSKTRHIIGFFGTMVLSFINTITGGMGPMLSSFYIANYGKTYISAAAVWKPASYFGSGAAAIVFLIGKVIDWQLFVVLVPGFMLGSYFGVHYGLKRGEKWIRNIVIIVVFATAIKFIFF